ncbi:2-hydroxyacid dehydrogenase [Oceanomicrobium pacificus]|uniref:D-glycerate dehydrogenase n=1 Tax=Oceanomicrobium pacificus TaxID=2692916 RepID=A0A6B0TIG4_9RHOB|nr:D-glycerate dehydrogenase [Oceanomicrobium pacificus]MXU64210.1 D-glycerate dehydrogenase [Oceanomicrobium pacificus]
MTKPRLIVTRKLPDAVEDRLKAHFAVALNPSDQPFSQERLVAAMQQGDAILPTVSDRIDAQVIEAAGRRRCRIISNFGVGVSNIDLRAAEFAGLPVTNTPGVLTDATADIAILLMLSVTRRAWEMESMLRAGKWTGFAPAMNLGSGLQGKVLGIIGMGRIGQAVAERAYFGFGMKIVYVNRSARDLPQLPTATALGTVDELMELSDVVSLHAPGGGENSHLIGEAQLKLMKPGAFLINTARGDLIDERALTNALVERRIAGAGLDVFAEEPRVPAVLRRLNNVALLPHLGSATLETRTAMGMKAADNLIAFFDGKSPPDLVG